MIFTLLYFHIFLRDNNSDHFLGTFRIKLHILGLYGNFVSNIQIRILYRCKYIARNIRIPQYSRHILYILQKLRHNFTINYQIDIDEF